MKRTQKHAHEHYWQKKFRWGFLVLTSQVWNMKIHKKYNILSKVQNSIWLRYWTYLVSYFLWHDDSLGFQITKHCPLTLDYKCIFSQTMPNTCYWPHPPLILFSLPSTFIVRPVWKSAACLVHFFRCYLSRFISKK